MPSPPSLSPPSAEEQRPFQLRQGQWFRGVGEQNPRPVVSLHHPAAGGGIAPLPGSPGLAKQSFQRPEACAQRELFFTLSKGVTVLGLECWTRLTSKIPRCQALQKHNEWSTGKSLILYFYKHHFFLAPTATNYTKYEPRGRAITVGRSHRRVCAWPRLVHP